MDGRRTPFGLEQRLLARARAAGFGPGTPLIVAFSGGRDSLALAAALRWSRDLLGLEPLLVHVDHRLRDASRLEAAAARKLARALGLEIRMVAPTAAPPEIHPHVGVEEAARRERYRLLMQAARELGALAVATAHHQDDQAETVLLHLLRGSGVHGAAGMKERVAAPYGGGETQGDISPKVVEPWIWRPFLSEPRGEITAYVMRLGLDWVEDSSNAETQYRRNMVRHTVLPMLEAYVPGATVALARYASLAAEDDDTLTRLASDALAGQVDPGGLLAVAALDDRPLSIQRRIVRQWIAEVTDLRMMTADRGDAILALVCSGAGGRAIEIGEGWTVSLGGGMLRAWQKRSKGEGAK